MEPEIFSELKRYFQAGGNPVQVIDLLSRNYVGKLCMTILDCQFRGFIEGLFF